MSLKSKIFDCAAGFNRSSTKPIFIIGHGRSGTTWVGDTFEKHERVLHYNEPARYGFKDKERQYDNFLAYTTNNETAGYIKERLDAAMGGYFLADSAVWLSDRQKVKLRLMGDYRLVIKEVATIMCMEWVYRTYSPDVLILYRHPCSVALSEKERDIDAELSRKILLSKDELFRDHLEPYRALIERAKRPYEVYGAVYGARNRVLANFAEKYKIKNVLLYEDLATDPIAKFSEVFGWFGLEYTEDIKTYVQENSSSSKQGFYTTTKISAAHRERWKQKMTAAEASQVAEFVLPFQLPCYDRAEDFLIS